MHHNLPRWCVSDMPHFYVSSLTLFPVSVTLLQSHHRTHHPFCHAQNLPHWCASNSPNFSASSLTHFSVSLALLQGTRFMFLATSRRCIGAIARSHVMSFIGRWILLGHGRRRKSNLMDPVVMFWIQPWCQMTAQFLWIIEVFQCDWTYLLTLPICVFVFSLLLVKLQYCRQNC